MLLAQQGGAQAVRNAGAIDAYNLMTPLFEQYQNQLDASQKINFQLLQELQELHGVGADERRWIQARMHQRGIA